MKVIQSTVSANRITICGNKSPYMNSLLFAVNSDFLMTDAVLRDECVGDPPSDPLSNKASDVESAYVAS